MEMISYKFGQKANKFEHFISQMMTILIRYASEIKIFKLK